MKIRFQTPREVADYISRNESFCRSGDTLRGEGGDYLAENENRHLKSHLPPGVPTLQCWNISRRNHQKLVKNCEEVFKKAGVTDPATESSSIINFENEVTMLRIAIRKSGILSRPYEEFPLRSLEGKLLHPKGNLLHPNDINNWTIEKIKQKTQQLIQQMLSRDSQNSLMNFFKQMSKKSKKADYISFYNDV